MDQFSGGLVSAIAGVYRMGCAVITIVGVGPWGCKVLNALASDMVSMTNVVAVDTDPLALLACQARTLVLAEKDWATWVMLSTDPCSGYGSLQTAVSGTDMVLLLGDPRETKLRGLLGELSSLCLSQGIVTVPVCPISCMPLGGHVIAGYLTPVESLPLPMTVFLDACSGDAGLALSLCQAICSVILKTSVIGVDFADVRTALDEPGFAFASMGVGVGDNRAQYASLAVLSESSVFTRSLPAARALLAVIMVNEDPGLDEFTTVGEWVSRYVSADATVIIGVVTDPSIDASEMRLLMLATGIESVPPFAVPYPH